MRILLYLLLMLPVGALAATVHDTLYINAGTALMYDGTTFPFKAFNASDQFDQQNKLVLLNAGDQLELVIINNDVVQHGFTVRNSLVAPIVIAPTDTGYFSQTFTDQASHVYYDHLDHPNNSYIGLGGMLAVLGSSDSEYYWDLKTHDSTYSAELDMGNTVDWTSYYPEHFTINGKSHPETLSDTLTSIQSSMGEVMHIYIANPGRSMHSIHFHGYHCSIIYSSQHPDWLGRSKDTFPLDPLETMIVELIPDQPGLYPIHDHNLVAISGSGIYLNGGMLLTIDIQ